MRNIALQTLLLVGVFWLIFSFSFSITCNSTITNSTTLTGDLNCNGSQGIIINGTNVVLDCAGYKLYNYTAYGLYIKGVNVTVKNCNISGEVPILVDTIYTGNHSNTIKIINNTILSDFDGIKTYSGTVTVEIIGNTMKGNQDYYSTSIWLNGDYLNATIKENNISNYWEGVYIPLSNGIISVENNNITTYGYAISSSGDYNHFTIINNRINCTGSNQWAVGLWSDNITVSLENNTIFSESHGIKIITENSRLDLKNNNVTGYRDAIEISSDGSVINTIDNAVNCITCRTDEDAVYIYGNDNSINVERDQVNSTASDATKNEAKEQPQHKEQPKENQTAKPVSNVTEEKPNETNVPPITGRATGVSDIINRIKEIIISIIEWIKSLFG